MNLLNQVVEDRRYLDAQSRITTFSVFKTKRQLTYSNLKTLLSGLRSSLNSKAVVACSVRRSLFWRFLRDHDLLRLLLCFEALEAAAELQAGSEKQILSLRKIGLQYLDPAGRHYVGDEGTACVTELDCQVAALIRARGRLQLGGDDEGPNGQGEVAPAMPPPALTAVMEYLLDRMNDQIAPFLDSPYGLALATFENYAKKPRTMQDFEKLRLLGEGGFGKVHAVRVVDTNAIWALKEMSKARIITKKRLGTVVAEATILRKLDYPFVARVHQVFQDEMSVYFLLDILPGGELKYHLRRIPVIPHEIAQFWMACLVLGVGYLHSRNVIHRDLKPSNCMLDSSGFVVICDFGLSVTADSAEALRHEQCCGTPGYIAPEMYLGPCWDRRQRAESKRRQSITSKPSMLSALQSSLRALTSRSTKVDVFDPSNAQLARGAHLSARADAVRAARTLVRSGSHTSKRDKSGPLPSKRAQREDSTAQPLLKPNPDNIGGDLFTQSRTSRKRAMSISLLPKLEQDIGSEAQGPGKATEGGEEHGWYAMQHLATGTDAARSGSNGSTTEQQPSRETADEKVRSVYVAPVAEGATTNWEQAHAKAETPLTLTLSKPDAQPFSPGTPRTATSEKRITSPPPLSPQEEAELRPDAHSRRVPPLAVIDIPRIGDGATDDAGESSDSRNLGQRKTSGRAPALRAGSKGSLKAAERQQSQGGSVAVADSHDAAGITATERRTEDGPGRPSRSSQMARTRRQSTDEGADEFPRYENYGTSVDIFALGVVMHQMYCLGRLPFTRGPKRSHRTLLRNMMQGKVRWSEASMQHAERNRKELLRRGRDPTYAHRSIMGLTYEAQDLVNQLLFHDPELRLGCGRAGVEEIKRHPFFDGIDWEKLERRHLVPPFMPSSNNVNAEFHQAEWDSHGYSRKDVRKAMSLTDDHHRQTFKELEYVRTATLFEEMASCQVNYENLRTVSKTTAAKRSALPCAIQ